MLVNGILCNVDHVTGFPLITLDFVLRLPVVCVGNFNADPDRPVRLISSINRIFKYCGLNDLEQIENAPEFDPSVTLDCDAIMKYLRK